MTHIYLAVPCFGGQITTACHRSITLLTHLLAKHGVEWTLDHEIHESLVQRARNSLTHRMLKSTATHLFFIDADIDFRPIDVIGMLGADKPLVCGAYPKKTIDVEAVRAACLRGDAIPMDSAANFATNALPGASGERETTVVADGGCVPILDAPTGFMLVQRHVLLEMVASHPETLYYSDSAQNRGEAMHALFDCAIIDGRYLSEDYLFSRRWQKLGGTVWLFLPAVLGHVGSHTYRGDLFRTFRPADEECTAADRAKELGDAPGLRSVASAGGATEWCDIPSLPDSDPQKRWHLYRYEWARDRLKGKVVANAPCGSNYGTPILAENAEEVVGHDRSQDAARVAKERGYGDVRVLDLERENIGGVFDSVVCLEGIEHLKDPWAWVGGLPPSVRELTLSAPIVPTKHTNRFHMHDFTEADVIDGVRGLGWRVTHLAHQDEWAPSAVLLLRAER